MLMTNTASCESLILDDIEAPPQLIARHTRRVIAGAPAERPGAAAGSTIMA